MYNIKSLLTEELILNDKKNLLSEYSLLMINDSNYVKHVLGIDVPLNEHYSLALRKRIIEEQLSMQGVLNSANKFLGAVIEKGKENVIKVVDTISSMKDVTMLFRDLILSPENMESANRALAKVCNSLSSSIDELINYLTNKLKVNIAGFSDKMTGLLTHIKNVLINLTTTTGWLGFLSKLGFATLITYIKVNFFDTILKSGMDFITKTPNLLAGISTLLNMFEDFKTTIINSIDISSIVSWIVNIGKTAATQHLALGFDIMVAVTTVLTPVLKSMAWEKKLQKR
jgi:hypothetical protein